MPELLQFPGEAYPLGATWNGEGVNFAIFAENATSVELCFYDSEHAENETHRITILERSHEIWHAYIPDIKPGQLYGYRVHGPYEPENGCRFNANKVLLDPYAKAIAGNIRWDNSLFGYELGDPLMDLSFSESDNTAFIPKSVVIDPEYDWTGDIHPKTDYHETVIYEMHVKGFTKTHPDIPENIRGTYAGLAHPAAIDYLKKLGVTAVELMPVHQFISDHHLQEKGLTNYWGYNTIGFFAPDSRYASSDVRGGQVNEFKDMVKALHAAGIEVILDVVYNHTGEGNELGPTLSFKGIDNSAYYRLEENKRYYTDYTGTGNTLNSMLPNVLRFMMDSLRYWIQEMHVDGFRFDLASTLARELHEVNRLSAFFDIIHQDPVISQVKLIAEPWDVGDGGYQVGKFPAGWAEWNGMYRDVMRDYWRGNPNMLGEFAQRFLGSPDLYQEDYRRPTASINFITAHDGFSLQDLVSYNEKHNEANLDDNTDGEDHNRSWNCGAEGETDDVEILNLRQQQKRNFLATLFLSQGIPMLVSGDELGKTQKGNNNTYCQDNELSWLNWAAVDESLLHFTQQLIQLRLNHPSLRRRKWFNGQEVGDDGVKDIAWFTPDGNPMKGYNWESDFARSIGIYFHGEGIQSKGPMGEDILDNHFFIIFNAHYEGLNYKLPKEDYAKKWRKVLDTASGEISSGDLSLHEASETLIVEGRSILVLKSEE